MPENRLARPKSFQFLTAPIYAIFLVLLLFGLSWAQTTSSQSPSSPAAPSPPEQRAESQAPITKAQAKELFRSVDEILEFASHDTGLPITH